MKSSGIFGVKFSKNIGQFSSLMQKQYGQSKGREVPEILPLLVEKKICHYYITQSVIHDSSKIILDDLFDLVWLKDKIKDGVYQWSFDSRVFRFCKTNDRLIAIYAMKAPDPLAQIMGTNSFGVDYIVFDFDIANANVESWVASYKHHLAQEARLLFYQLLTFIYLAPVEVIVVDARKKNGTKKNPVTQFLNEEHFPFTIINSNWNKLIARLKPFWVEGESGYGFLRKQACGPQWKDRKLIWIEPFEKSKYVRAETKRLKGIQ